jgi:hypothetical protein
MILAMIVVVGLLSVGWVAGVAAYRHRWHQNEMRDWDQLAARDRDRPSPYDHPSVYEPRYFHVPRRLEDE